MRDGTRQGTNVERNCSKPLCKVWKYGLWSFQTGGSKLEKKLPKNQHTQSKLLNFENWVSVKNDSNLSLFF